MYISHINSFGLSRRPHQEAPLDRRFAFQRASLARNACKEVLLDALEHDSRTRNIAALEGESLNRGRERYQRDCRGSVRRSVTSHGSSRVGRIFFDDTAAT